MTTQASVKWEHGLTFTGTAPSGFQVPLGGNRAEGGDEDGFRPMELMLVGVAGCTGMDVISILEKKRQAVTGFEVNVRGERATEHPKVFTDIEIEYVVYGHNVDPVAVARSIELSTTKYCSAINTLIKAVPIRHTFRIVESGATEPA